jgi:short-subunit dehydrogenase
MPGEALREYLAPEGVSVSLVYPGYIQTAQTACHIGALPLQMLPDRAAAIIRSRVDRGRSFIAFPLRLLVQGGVREVRATRLHIRSLLARALVQSVKPQIVHQGEDFGFFRPPAPL